MVECCLRLKVFGKIINIARGTGFREAGITPIKITVVVEQ